MGGIGEGTFAWCATGERRKGDRRRSRFKADRTYLEINQKLERPRVNDVDKTANDRTVSRIKLNVRRAGHFSFKILGCRHRRNDNSSPLPHQPQPRQCKKIQHRVLVTRPSYRSPYHDKTVLTFSFKVCKWSRNLKNMNIHIPKKL